MKVRWQQPLRRYLIDLALSLCVSSGSDIRRYWRYFFEATMAAFFEAKSDICRFYTASTKNISFTGSPLEKRQLPLCNFLKQEDARGFFQTKKKGEKIEVDPIAEKGLGE